MKRDERKKCIYIYIYQCVQFSSNSRKILEFWLLDDFPRILVDPRGSSRKFDSGSNSADLRVSSRKFDLGVVPSIACVTFMVYTNSAIEILLNTFENPHLMQDLYGFPVLQHLRAIWQNLQRSLRSQYILQHFPQQAQNSVSADILAPNGARGLM